MDVWHWVYWLVVSTHLKNMSSSVGMMTFPIFGKNMFQTTSRDISTINPSEIGVTYVHQLHRLENHLTGPTIFPTMAIRWSLFAPQLSQWNWQTLLHAILRYWKDHHRTIWLCLKFILSHIAGIPWALTISIWIKRMNTVHRGFGGPKNQRQPYRFVFKEEDYNFFLPLDLAGYVPQSSWSLPL